MTARLIVVEEDANFTGGDHRNSLSLSKMCTLAVWHLKKVRFIFLAGLLPVTVTNSLNSRTTSYDTAA